MTTGKPDDISQEAWDEAEVYVRRWANGPGTIWQTVARAILAAKAEERESIAAFCEVQSPRVVGQLFAAAIRKRGGE